MTTDSTKHAAKRLSDTQGNTTGYEYRDTVIEKNFTWIISGFGPEGWSEHPTLAAAKAYIDKVKEA